MKKRVLAALLCVAMVTTSLVGCTGTANNTEKPGTENTENPGSEKPGTENPGTENPGTEISVEPLKYYGFESTDEGWTVVVADDTKASNKAYDAALATGNVARTIVAGDKALADLTHTGVKGQCAYLDRSYALDLEWDATNTDAWSVSFWVWGLGMTDFMPTLQFGTDLGFADGQGNVAWLNVTKTTWPGADAYPMLWSRNEADGSWPWMYAYDTTLHAYKDWTHITIVATGETYTGPTGLTCAAAQLYLDGQLVFDSMDNFNNATYFEVTDTDTNATMAAGLMKPVDGSTFESYFGINYWDTMFKGCVDEMYLFDKAISADDVAALYAMGNGEADPVVDTSGEPKENAKPAPNADAIERVGANDYTQAFWTDFSDIVEVPTGTTKTITFKNYHTNLSFGNWNNAVVVLQNTPTGHSVTGTENGVEPVDGYKEYAVVRMDNYGWGAGYADIATATCDWDWATFKDETHDATVEVSITNNGTTADIVIKLTAKDGTVRNQSYTGIAVDGPVYTCLTVDKACIDILEIK